MTNSFIQPPCYYDHILFLAKCTSWKILCFIFLMTCFLWPPPYWPNSGHIITRFHCTLYWIIFSLVRQLHREFLRAGSDVIQAFTFTLDDDLGGEHAKHGVGIILSLNFLGATVLLGLLKRGTGPKHQVWSNVLGLSSKLCFLIFPMKHNCKMRIWIPSPPPKKQSLKVLFWNIVSDHQNKPGSMWPGQGRGPGGRGTFCWINLSDCFTVFKWSREKSCPGEV